MLIDPVIDKTYLLILPFYFLQKPVINVFLIFVIRKRALPVIKPHIYLMQTHISF